MKGSSEMLQKVFLSKFMKKDADVGELWLKETATSVQTSRGTV
jgi:hypothetical protein